jgi:hypothetical protein
MQVVLQRVLTREGNCVSMNPALNKDVAILMKAVQGAHSLLKGIYTNSISSHNIAEIEKCCHTLHLSNGM